MTERVLPQVGIGIRPAARPGARPVEPASVASGARTIPLARPAAGREALLSTPARAGMLLGASAALYAVTLAGVAAIQAGTDAAAVAARAPYQDAVAATRAGNDALEAQVLKADAEVRALVALYGEVGGDVTAYQARLDSLAALVAEVQGTAASLPARIKLPSVSARGAIAGSARSGGGTSRPATSAKTGASGG